MCLLVGDTNTIARRRRRAAGVPCVLGFFGPSGGRYGPATAPEALLDTYDEPA